jgi:hypothetical protein
VYVMATQSAIRFDSLMTDLETLQMGTITLTTETLVVGEFLVYEVAPIYATTFSLLTRPGHIHPGCFLYARLSPSQ